VCRFHESVCNALVFRIDYLQLRPSRRSQRAFRKGGYVRYRGNENYVAMAMAVDVDRASGKVTVKRVVCGHDCGLTVNADSLKNQIEGSIVQSLSKILFEERKFDRSRVTSVDWTGYPVIRLPDVPQIDIALIDRPDQPLMGAGEASLPPVGGALANAIFDAPASGCVRFPLRRQG
jgi:nicotinate dehydrogenase subunit B